MILQAWHRRPVEEAHLFNPAFCGSLSYEFVKSYSRAKGSNVAFPLIFCALPVVLHSKTRKLLPGSTITSVYTWMQRNPRAIVGFAERAKNLKPFVCEALQFSIARNTLAIDNNGAIQISEKRAAFTPKLLESASSEMNEIVRATRMMGRWFAGAGEPGTILAALGITV